MTEHRDDQVLAALLIFNALYQSSMMVASAFDCIDMRREAHRWATVYDWLADPYDRLWFRWRHFHA